MKVKALRRGFDNTKLREEGEVFNMDVEKCPSWCEQLDAKQPAKKKEDGPITVSKGTTIDKCAPLIAAMETVDEVEKFCIGDERNGIQEAAAARIAELNA